MEPPARLKWARVEDGFKAYPIGSNLRGRYARVWKTGSGINTDQTPHFSYEHWAWCVHWEGWFSRSGFSDSRQAAADRATIEWWAGVNTELPRNVDLEAEMIAARVLVRPIPNSLLGEEAKFLLKVMWHLNEVHGRDLAKGEAPAAVKEVVERLSTELYQRRLAGEYKEPTPYVRSQPGPRRRRR